MILSEGACSYPDIGAIVDALVAAESEIWRINGPAYILPVVDPQGQRFVQLP